MSVLEYWLWLSGAAVSSRAKAALIRHYGDAEAVYNAPADALASVEGVGPAEARLLESRDLSPVFRIEEACAEQNIGIITMQDALYPKRLKNTFGAPPVLYVKGRLPDVDANALIAVVGTRKASPYGLKMARRLAFEIAACGGMVVSGLTAGIDAEAARGALLAGGKCLAVLGSAHECFHSPLAEDIAGSGAIVSEYAPGTVTQKSFFRARNRISAGLSVGTLVVEAPLGSGALLFAQEALEQGREIFAVPGNADSANSAGCISLLKNGAKPVTEGWDVLCEFAPIYGEKLRAEKPAMPPVFEREPTAPAERLPSGELKRQVTRQEIELRAQLEKLSEQELCVIAAIDIEGTHTDDIMEKTGMPLSKLMGVLTFLEIKGYVRRLPGSRIALNTAKK